MAINVSASIRAWYSGWCQEQKSGVSQQPLLPYGTALPWLAAACLSPLLSRGPNIKVLEPEWLVEEIKEQIERMKKVYG